jgi:hypothetical protein
MVITDKWAKKVIDELTTTTGQLKNPDVTKQTKNVPHGIGNHQQMDDA